MLHYQTQTDLKHYLAICHIPQIGCKKLQTLFEAFGSFAELFNSDAATLHHLGYSHAQAKALLTPDYTRAEADLAWREAGGNRHIITWFDPKYPACLRQIDTAPPILYAQGQISCLSNIQMAIVGSRNPSASGLMNAQTLSTELAQAGYTITSGLALGIDAKAHQAALAVSRPTVAVLGAGLNHIYPRSHQALAQQISEQGLLVSEFAVDTPPVAQNFPRRNRIISGLSVGVLVVEAALKSGSLITARYALEQNREVFAIPGAIHNPLAQGCHALLRQGAKLVETVTDILEELPYAVNKPEGAVHTHRIQVSKIEQYVLDLMRHTPTSFDVLIEQTELTAPALMALLSQLEVRGLIQATPSGYIPFLERANEIQCA